MKKILIANRGEIALRIIRACSDAGYISVAIASEADCNALHARHADECHLLKGNSPRETYLNQDAILKIACDAGVDAVHPGYGLLSENEVFAAAVEAAGLTWIGPPPLVIAQLGDKVAARKVAKAVGAQLLPTFDDENLTFEKAEAFVKAHGLPVIIKAKNGGGGRGMRIVRSESELEAQLTAASREAEIAFGRPECFVERYLDFARHVETQCLADNHGAVLVVSTRDCTLQRRQQKLIEEAPAPFLSAAQNEQLNTVSAAILSTVGYRGAATCEFLVDQDGDMYFLEVNTRIQVEHPVTEEVTGLDLMLEMFNIAENGHLPAQAPAVHSHAIEFRINAEDPWHDFRPTPGPIERLNLPQGPGVRLDFGFAAGDTVSSFYDSMIGKVIVTGADRKQALARARRVLSEFSLSGFMTLKPLHQAILNCPEFVASTAAEFTVHTRWIEAEIARLEALAPPCQTVAEVTLGDSVSEITLTGQSADADPSAPIYRVGIKAPLSGTVIELLVAKGDAVRQGDVIAIMEAMKMEQAVVAEHAGTVVVVNALLGGYIDVGDDIVGLD